MNDNSYPNIVWFVVDSIRTYPTDGDLRGKLEFMGRFAAESVEFTTCVTTAPSTIMSITGMLTGLPAYFLARNYQDFRFDDRHHHSLRAVLERHGYANFAFLRSFETRLKLKNLLDPVPRKLWPRHFRHRTKWPNEHLNVLLERVLAEGVPNPAFLFFHYNPQTRSETNQPLDDPAVSERLESAYRSLVDAGFTPDNTIFVLCSDHGFPDPSSGLSTEWEIRHRLTHDLVMTDDNILIPLYIRYPGCEAKKIDTPVSSLDVFPTLLDLAGIPDARPVQAELDGTSLLPLLGDGDVGSYPRRHFRCDARLMFQTGRATVIRSRDFKYIRYHDEHRLNQAGKASLDSEVLIDLREDPEERVNVLLHRPLASEFGRALNVLRMEFDRSEARAIQYQVNYMVARQAALLSGGRSSEIPRRVLLMLEPGTAAFSEIAAQAVAQAIPGSEIDVLDDGSGRASSSPADRRFSYAEGSDGSISAPEELTTLSEARYDLTLLLVQSAGSKRASDLLGIAESIRARRRLVIDCNFNAYRRTRYWRYRFRALIQQLAVAREEPGLVVRQLKLGGRVIMKDLLTKLGLWDRWRAAKTEDTND